MLSKNYEKKHSPEKALDLVYMYIVEHTLKKFIVLDLKRIVIYVYIDEGFQKH